MDLAKTRPRASAPQDIVHLDHEGGAGRTAFRYAANPGRPLVGELLRELL